VAKILAITNQKGGVGKTTSAINIAASIARNKRRVLLVDIDPQGNATMGSGINKNAYDVSLCEVLTGECDIYDAIHKSSGNYNVLVGNSNLTAAEVNLMFMDNKEYRLKEQLKKVSRQYDYIIIDCPPSLNMLTINALSCADGIIIPMQCEYYALEGLAALIDTVSGIKNSLNSKLKIEGILRTMYDPRLSLTYEVSRQLMHHFGRLVYRTVIPRNVRLAEAPSHGMAVISYDRYSRGALAYLALANEIVRRCEKKKVKRTLAKSKA
jgi:chromosome partitioning protein